MHINMKVASKLNLSSSLFIHLYIDHLDFEVQIGSRWYRSLPTFPVRHLVRYVQLPYLHDRIFKVRYS